MRPQDIIAKKRDGESLSENEIEYFIGGVSDGTWADYQITALLMAMFLNELNLAEQSFITQAMLNSGEVLDFSDIDKPKVDKHSTGGVGDKTSLIIAPIAAACGVAVPMISGRGLGHTGGTLDKLEAIEGFNVNLTTTEFRSIIKECGYAMAGQTAEIAPADKKIYALRDATATVPTIPLIVASIMSKKLAEGLDSLVLDVKTGNGAFMQDFDDAKRLANALVKTGNSCGVKTQALITDMNQPLGKYVGNAHEVYESVKILRNEIEDGMQEILTVSTELIASILIMSGLSERQQDAKNLVNDCIVSGRGLEKFRQNIELQKGDTKIVDNPEILLSRNLIEVKIQSKSSGYIFELDTLVIGKAVSEIGGGRMKVEDSIDYSVGFANLAKLGQKISVNDTLGVLYCRNKSQANLISKKLQNAYKIGESKIEAPDLIKEAIH